MSTQDQLPPDITLHYFRDTETQTTGYLIKIPDARLEGMAGPDLKSILPNVWLSARSKGDRLHLLAQGVAAIDRYRPLGGPPATIAKPSRRARLACFINNLIWGRMNERGN
jgi:hypothetical protein